MRLGRYEAGPSAGLPQVLCHGWPELAFSRRHQIAAFAAAADGMENRIPDLEKVLIRECGHRTMQEKPDEVNVAAPGWVKRKFG